MHSREKSGGWATRRSRPLKEERIGPGLARLLAILAGDFAGWNRVRPGDLVTLSLKPILEGRQEPALLGYTFSTFRHHSVSIQPLTTLLSTPGTLTTVCMTVVPCVLSSRMYTPTLSQALALPST
jgi:hypothetical protein